MAVVEPSRLSESDRAHIEDCPICGPRIAHEKELNPLLHGTLEDVWRAIEETEQEADIWSTDPTSDLADEDESMSDRSTSPGNDPTLFSRIQEVILGLSPNFKAGTAKEFILYEWTRYRRDHGRKHVVIASDSSIASKALALEIQKVANVSTVQNADATLRVLLGEAPCDLLILDVDTRLASAIELPQHIAPPVLLAGTSRHLTSFTRQHQHAKGIEIFRTNKSLSEFAPTAARLIYGAESNQREGHHRRRPS